MSKYAQAFDATDAGSLGTLEDMTVAEFMGDFGMTKIHANKLKMKVT